MPADRVVSVSGTERGHDTRPGEIEAVAAAIYHATPVALLASHPTEMRLLEWAEESERRKDVWRRMAIAALDAVSENDVTDEMVERAAYPIFVGVAKAPWTSRGDDEFCPVEPFTKNHARNIARAALREALRRVVPDVSR